MEYQVLARKWRPQNFNELVGQQHVIKTLQNALIREKTAHAYLFVGPRGVGKTTIARVFAKTLNCAEAPTSNPCCKCESCISIAEGRSVDLIEIDGASNNSVNDVRNIRDEVMYAPANSRYKIYIIDEVHMLSSAAWNALLKTLEEPPAHAKFIFATTEVHKILPTVLSRCQRFDLTRVSEKLIVSHLENIVKSEGEKVSAMALSAIARAADGGIRDSLSLLDQIMAFHSPDDNNEISESQVLETFGLTAPQEIYDIVDAIIDADNAKIIQKLSSQAKHGKNLEKLFNEILVYLRGIEICQILNDPSVVLEESEELIKMYKELASKTKLAAIQKLLEELSISGKLLFNAINKQIFLETIILKAVRIANTKSIDDILSTFNKLNDSEIIKASKAETVVTENKEPLEKKNDKEPEVVEVPIANVSNDDKTEEIIEQPKESISNEAVINTKECLESAAVDYKVEEPREAYLDSMQPSQQISSEQNIDEPVIEESTETISEVEIEKPAEIYIDLANSTPEEIWHGVILSIERSHQTYLKLHLKSGKAISYSDNLLTVVYDAEFGTFPADEVEKEIKSLTQHLRLITRNNSIELNISKQEGIAEIDEVINKTDIDEVKKIVDESELVKYTMSTFNGTIVQYRG